MSLKDKFILVVDDEGDIREILKDQFESEGGRVLEAENGRVALELMKKNKFDLLVSDVRMPGGDSKQLLREVKRLNLHLPQTFLITGYADITEEEAQGLGVIRIFNKPFDIAEFMNIIRSYFP